MAVLSNADLAVTPPEKRTWRAANFAALWVSMSLCIPTYMLASSLIDGGMNWWQAILTVFVGNLVVLAPMLLNGDAGARYGVPFPVFIRSSFGVNGANIPALLRALVACGWFGIQTWIGGEAVYQLLRLLWPRMADWPHILPGSLDLAGGPALGFGLFLLVNLAVIHKGIDGIRRLLLFKAVFLPIASLALLVWAIVAAGGLGPILARPSAFQDTSSFLRFFVPGVTGIVGFWATLSLNIPDFTRFAESQRAHRIGQSIALPAAMAAFAFVGVVVTSASAVRFGKVIWDPLALAARIESPLIIAAVMVLVAVSTLATNIAANIVSPANDFANLAPSLISFRTGGYMTAVIGALIMPWKLIADPSGYIFTWLIAYSSLLGPIAGIMITDYYGVRRRDLVVEDLYRRGGAYWYVGGFNPAALVAFVAGVSPCVPGFLVTAGLLSSEAVPGWLGDIYRYAWFVGFGVAAIVYWVLTPRQTQSPARQVDSLTRA